MENILQSIVKIIIIGVLYGKINVDCNRQFLAAPPPLPYYHNDDYYVPGFAPAYHDQLPIYYPEQNLPNPIPYQNMKSYTPPQLFYQNENYIPPMPANPGLRYSLSQAHPYKQAFQQPQKPQQQNLNFGLLRVQVKSPPQVQARRPQEISQKKTEAFASNIIVKDEPLSPYYQDDYGKNYNDEDYTDNYSDDSPALLNPCPANGPYRYFQAPKGTPNTGEKYTLCGPNFQPNFGSSIYTVKMPITLLPSRFPPRVEQLIERIQNYFSTYTQQQTPGPQNETSSASTFHPTVETSSETPSYLSTTETVDKKNTTIDNRQETSSEAADVGDSERMTEKTFVAAMETKDPQTSLTAAPDAQVKKESQMEVETTQRVEEVAETASDAVTEKLQTVTETSSYEELPGKPENAAAIEGGWQSTQSAPAEDKTSDVTHPTSSNG